MAQCDHEPGDPFVEAIACGAGLNLPFPAPTDSPAQNRNSYQSGLRALQDLIE